MNLSHTNGEVYGFDSTWDQDKQAHVCDKGTETTASQIETEEKNTQVKLTKEIGVRFNFS